MSDKQGRSAASNIDEYIAAQNGDVREILVNIRETIRACAPEAEERMSWAMPTFWQGENLIHFYAYKKHIGLYPGEVSRLGMDERLSGYTKSKGAIRLPLDKPVDYELIADITRKRVEQVTEQ